MPLGLVLNPTSDPLVTHTAQLDIADGTVYRAQEAAFPPPSPKPAYASSYDTEGSIATDPAHYENREITVKLLVCGSSTSTLEVALNNLTKMVGLINSEGGSLKLTTPNSTVCYFDLPPEATASVTTDMLYVRKNLAEVTCTFVARPFWRGAEVDLGSYSETSLPVLTGVWPQPVFDSPDDIAGLERWYRPESLGADTTAVSSWTDESGNASHLTQGTGSKQPVVAAGVLDGKKVVRFDGTDDELQNTVSADASRTIFIVAKEATNITGRVAWSLNSTSARLDVNATSGGQWRWGNNQAATAVVIGGTPAATSWSAITLRVTSTTVMDAYQNGGAAVNFDPNDTVTTATTMVAGAAAAANFWNGDIAEIIIYNSALADADKDKVLGYLSAKYPTLGSFGTAVGAQQTIDGDVPALGRLVVTDSESGGKDRWTVVVGGQSRYYSAATTAKVFYEAEALTPTGTSAIAAGATGASGSGSNVMRNTDLTTTYQAVLKSTILSGTASLTHKGTYRIWARLYRPTGNTGAVSVRLEWGEGDMLRAPQNDPVVYPVSDREGVFTWANLGVVSIDPASTRWEFRLLAKSTAPGDEIDVDCFLLAPTEVVYTELAGKLQYQNPTSFSALSTFDTESGVITGDSLTTGGAWTVVTGSDTDDYSAAAGVATRTSVSDTDAREVTAGTTNYTAIAVQTDVMISAYPTIQGQVGVVARSDGTAIINSAKAYLQFDSGATDSLRMVMGASSIWQTTLTSRPALNTFYTIRLQVDPLGRFWVWWFPRGFAPGPPLLQGQDAALATGGARATGRIGIHDNWGTGASTRTFDNFLGFVPTSDAAIFGTQSLTLGPTYATREDSTGTFPVTISDRRGRYLKIPPSGPETRSTRLGILAVPNDPYTMGDAAAIYDLSAQLLVTPRGLVVPEA